MRAAEDRGRHRGSSLRASADYGDDDAAPDDEPDEDLEGEPRVANGLHVEEGLVWLGRPAHQLPDGQVAGQLLRLVGDDGHAQVRVSLEAERQDRHDHEEHGHERNYLQQYNSNNDDDDDKQGPDLQNINTVYKHSGKINENMTV